MKLFLKSLSVVLNALPKTDRVLLHWCHLYGKYGLEAPNLIGKVSAPTVTTGTSGSTTTTSTVFTGNNITATGGENATVRGVCYVAGSGGTPTTANSVVNTSGSYSTGTYNNTITGLTLNTTYSVRAYATNSGGTGYGSTVNVTTLNNTPPTVALNTPADVATGQTTTPTLEFTGTDAQSDTIEYNVQVDTASSFRENVAHISSATNSSSFIISGGTGSSGEDQQAYGQTFTPTKNISLVSIDIRIGNSGSPTDDVYLEVRSGSENGTLLGTSNSVSGTSMSGVIVMNFTFSSIPSLSASTTYYLVVQRSGVRDLSNYYFLSKDVDVYAGGLARRRINNAWLDFSTGDLYFVVYANEPPFLNKLSVTPDAGFANTVTPADTHPFNSGEKADYDIQAGDILTASTTYYWRVRGLDPSGSNTYGAWSTTRSFTTASAGGGSTGQIKVWNGTAFVAKPVKVWNGSAWVIKPVKRYNGTTWVTTTY